MFCTNCGRQIDGLQKFCQHCGASVGVSGNNYNQQSYVNNQTYTYNADSVKNFNLLSAYKEMFKKYAQFNGRSRRSEYWYALLANWIIIMLTYVLFFAPMFSDVVNYGAPTEATAVLMGLLGLLLLVYAFVVMIPSLALGVRRLHDIGKSGWFMLISLIPYVGSIILIVFMATDSQIGANQYGPNPKGM